MSKLNKIIRNIIIGATAASTSISHAAKSENIVNGNNDNDPITKSEDNSAPKLVFKEANNEGGMFLAQHASHSSHRSHSSHSSHSSHRSHYSSSGSFSATATSTDDLGGRFLREGTFGEDVYQLQGLLVDKGYGWSKEIVVKTQDTKLDNKQEVKLDDAFDDVLTNVVKAYQEDNKLVQDGIVGPITLAKLMITQ